MLVLGTFTILIACILEQTPVSGFYVRGRSYAGEPRFSSSYHEPLRSASLTRSRLGLGRSSASFEPRSFHSERRFDTGGVLGLSSSAYTNSLYDRGSVSSLYHSQTGHTGKTSKEVVGHSARVSKPSHQSGRVSDLLRLQQRANLASLLDVPRQHQRVSTSKEILGRSHTAHHPSHSLRQSSPLLHRVHKPRTLLATVSITKNGHSGKTSKEIIGHSTKSVYEPKHTHGRLGDLQPQPVDVDKIFGLIKKQQDLRKKQQEQIQKHQYELQKQQHELLKKQQKELQKQQEQLLKQKYTSKELLGLW